VFLTADTLSPHTVRFLQTAGVPKLEKPFDLGEVRVVVASALRAARAA
jgi:DNA-binding response OmpR family regulator